MARMRGAWFLVLACGCGEQVDGHPGAGLDVDKTELALTDTRRLVPAVTPLVEPTYPSLIDPDVRATLLRKGYGDWELAPGEPCVELLPDGVPNDEIPERGKHARRLLRFVHLADLNIVDDESPARAVNADQPAPFSSAFRPQETELCRMANAMVKTLNRVNAREPLSFVLLGGNVIDNAQSNELDWALQILGGAAKVECDSGEDNDLVPTLEDGKDPFEAPGLDVPFYWVSGNHDVLMQGSIPLHEGYERIAIGDAPLSGFELRDFSEPNGRAGSGPVPVDSRRRFMNRAALMQRVLEDGDGHGLSQAQVDSGKAFYSFDIDGTPLRFVILDTAAETGSFEGLLRQGDIDEFVRPLLDEARDDGKWVILVSHHPVRALSDGRGYHGNIQPDALTADAWLSVLGEYPNIVFSLAAHERADHVEELKPQQGHSFWELTTSAFGDYPHQARIVEVWDEGNGYVSLEAIYVDMDMSDDPVAEQGRHLGLMDYASGWNPQFSTGNTEQRNLKLFARTP